jgi:hypothetical protein
MRAGGICIFFEGRDKCILEAQGILIECAITSEKKKKIWSPGFRAHPARRPSAEIRESGRKTSAEQAKKGKCVKRAISAKNFGVKKLNSGWPALARVAC